MIPKIDKQRIYGRFFKIELLEVVGALGDESGRDSYPPEDESNSSPSPEWLE